MAASVVPGMASAMAGPVSAEAVDELALARKAVETLASRAAAVAVAESLTGGALCSALVGVPGASRTLRGGVVAYATDLKEALLGVDAALLRLSGPVDPDVAAQMAAGVRERLCPPDVPAFGVATTGVAGPEPQGGQPVGTVYLAVHGPVGARVERLDLDGDRAAIRSAAVLAALRLLTEEAERWAAAAPAE